ncbi:MAG TPA: class I SAM-dependent methyltransferase [Bryobacteraceae bacterium]|nr:class I SAM-dependent methyltransferase [Bryobacteraceae bacterium]
MESAELIAILQEVRERVRARNPEGTAGATGIPLPDLMPLVHARDSAGGKVAAIGSVNPRPGGAVNSLVQSWKKFVARVLDWHVREQVEFNRKVIDCVDATLDALNQSNRALTELGSRIAAVEQITEELKDIRNHWANWRLDWERKLQVNETQFLRNVAELQNAFQHRVTLMDSGYREALAAQHTDFTAALKRHGAEIQQHLWTDLERIRLEYERLIFSELRTIRQRAQLHAPAAPVQAQPAPAEAALSLPFDYGRFAERFRGSEEYVKAGQQFYLPHFEGRLHVLDIGCGRGEFLKMMRDAGISARGIDLSEESVALCRSKGLDAEVADLFHYLADLPEASLDGIFCAQVVEHLPPERLPEMIRLCATRLARNGVIAIETPNPECLAIFATHFYLDPTHTRPVPHPLLAFYLEEFGIGKIEVRKLSPAVESLPALGSLPEDFREAFFGGLDYAILGTKL